MSKPYYFNVTEQDRYDDDNIGTLVANTSVELWNKILLSCQNHFDTPNIDVPMINENIDYIIESLWTEPMRLTIKVDGNDYVIIITRTFLY